MGISLLLVHKISKLILSNFIEENRKTKKIWHVSLFTEAFIWSETWGEGIILCRMKSRNFSCIVFILYVSFSWTIWVYQANDWQFLCSQGGYPARLKKVLIVTAPLWFKAPFKILRLFVREKLRERVFTVSVPQLSLHVPRESLPVHLGGSLKINHSTW